MPTSLITRLFGLYDEKDELIKAVDSKPPDTGRVSRLLRDFQNEFEHPDFSVDDIEHVMAYTREKLSKYGIANELSEYAPIPSSTSLPLPSLHYIGPLVNIYNSLHERWKKMRQDKLLKMCLNSPLQDVQDELESEACEYYMTTADDYNDVQKRLQNRDRPATTYPKAERATMLRRKRKDLFSSFQTSLRPGHRTFKFLE